MHLEPRVSGEPSFHGGRLMSAVVVADQVDGQVSGHLLVDLDQKLLEFDGAVAPVQAGDYGAVGGVERREQAGRGCCERSRGSVSRACQASSPNAGCDRPNAWTWDFSSTDNTTAAS